jgi:L1 cell adhesion molecule like protein
MIPVDRVLSDAKMSKNDIHEIVLVGGSTRIPKVQELLSKYFNGKQPSKSINPDEAVAYGAAVQAAILNGGQTTKGSAADSVVVVDVAPLSLGIETSGGVMTKLIPRTTSIPAERKNTFSTAVDNQTAVTIQVYQGERAYTKDCIRLGKFNLSGIAPAPRGVPQIEVTFSLDANSILQVTATDKGTGQSQKITITNENGRLSESEIKRMLEDAKQYEADDRAATEKTAAKQKLESYVFGLRTSTINDTKTAAKLSVEDKTTLTAAVESAIKWLDEHSNEPKPIYEQKLAELESIANPIVSKLYGADANASANGEAAPGDEHSHSSAADSNNESRKGPIISEVD